MTTMAEVPLPVGMMDDLRSAWASVLGCKDSNILPTDDFFELGGDLQDAVRLASVPSPYFERLTPSDVLRNPRFSRMAEAVYSKMQNNHASTLETDVRAPGKESAPSHAGEQHRPLVGLACSTGSDTLPDREETIRKLKENLRQALPGYMIPDVFVPVRRMPLNLSGKMDRKKVRVYAQSMTSNELHRFANKSAKTAGPSTTAELRMASAWAKVLSIEREKIGAYDNFFHTGGDSVRAMRLVTQARLFGLNLSVQQIFKFPTLAEMAAQATSLGRGHQARVVVEPFSMVSQPGQIDDLRKRAASICRVEHLQVNDIYPCTPLQEGLMALSLKDTGRYVGQFVYKLPAHIDNKRLMTAWDYVAQTASSLRTRFVDLADIGLVQVVVDEAPTWKHASNLQRYLDGDKLSKIGYGGSCSHFGLVDDSGTRYFVLTAHHAIYDGWSINLLLERFEKAYLGATLQPGPGFNTFLQYCRNADHEQSKAFWAKELAGAPQCDFPPNVSNKFQPQQHQKLFHGISLPSGPVDSSITMSSKIRAAWALLLNTYSSADAVLFAMTLNGRNVSLSGIEEILGPTFATAPVHIQIDENQTISQFLSMVQTRATNMIPHEQYGMHNIKRISPELDAICDIQSLLIIQTAHESTEAGLGIEDVTKSYMMNKMFHSFALSTECTITQSGIEVDFTYDPAAISSQQMFRVAKQLENIILQLVNVGATSTALLLDIEKISPSDRQEVANWNSRVFPQRQCLVHELVEHQVDAQPHAIAICSWDGEMTFRQLNDAANRLAIQLRTFGVGKDVLVPLIFEKSVWTIVSMLAVLKAGGAYAALDPAHPESRLRALVQRLGARLLLTSRTCFEQSKRLGEEAIVVDKEYVASLPASSNLTVPAGIKPEHPAIILFTSGSTGLPKGIVIDHTAFTSSMLGHTSPLRFDQSKRVLQFTAYTSDVSMAEIFTSLSCGACVCVPSDGERMNSLATAIDRMQADWAYLTPSAAILFQPEDVPTLKTLVFGGEVPSRENLTRWAPALYLVNVYGPAETSIWTSCNPGLLPTDVCSYIGATLRCNAYIALPNRPDKLAPIGGAGELIVEGPNIACGYLNDPEKTSVTFLSSTEWMPESFEQPRRLYRTGDLVRYLDDGRLDFIGRRDTQVKLRGLRVELGEIEEQLRKDLHRSELAVEAVVPSGQDGVKFLAAFIALRSEKDIIDMEELGVIAETAEAGIIFKSWTKGLDARLSKVLPSFMVPSAFVPLWRLPLTGSAKTDRKALRSIGASMTVQELHQFTASTEQSRAPTTEIELQMQALWAKVLHRLPEDIHVEDNFFRHGGDSIRAMRLVSLARQEGLLLTVAEVLKFSTLSAMCERAIVDQHQTVVEVPPFSLLRPSTVLERLLEVVSERCAITIEEVEDLYPCTPLQDGLVMQAEKDPGSYVARMVFKLPPILDVELFQQAWTIVAASAASLRTRFVETEDGLLQVVLRSPPAWNRGHNLCSYLDADRRQPMTTGQACCRLAIVEDQSEKFFAFTAHHAVFDGWSLPLVFQQVRNAYLHRTTTVASPPFNTFIHFYLNTDMETSASYWRKALEDAPESSFPVSQPFNYKPKTHEKFHYTIPLSKQPSDGFTVSTRVRAAWAILLGAYTGSVDVVYAATLNGRSAPVAGIEQMMSPTFTTVPVRVKLPTGKQSTLEDLLNAIQTQSTEMIPHEQFGFQNIRRLSSEIQAACNLQSLLVVQSATDTSDEGLTASDLSLETVDIKLGQGSDVYHSFALSIECTNRASALDLEITFDPEVLDMTQIQRVTHQMGHVFQQMSDPTLLFANVEIISPSDRKELVLWNNQGISASTTTIPQLVRDRTLEQPKAMALCSWEGELSYHRLEELSSRFAVSLKAAGVSKGDLVPLLFEKSIWTVVTMLAVMRLGAAFAALDPAHPLERLQSLVKKLSAKLLLSSTNWAQKAQELSGVVRILTISPHYIQSLPPYDPREPAVEVSTTDTAFILFTSGSTGLPKGIIIDHSAFTSSIKGHAEALYFRQGSRNFQFTAYTSDVSMGEIFTSLAVGACVCIPSDYERINELPQVMNRLEVDWAFFTPSVASLLMPADIPMLRTMVLGGETASPELVERFAPALRLINSFGPAETSIWISRKATVTSKSSGSNIGVGIGCRTWLTDPLNHNRLAPIGAIGELVVEGPIVARGYLNDEAKTSAVFIQHAAWQSEKWSRIFRTGDLVRYLSNGDLHFIGRRDTQIKLRGLRIEVGEIEQQLRRCLPAIKELAVEAIVPYGGTNASKMLATFISMDNAEDSDCAIVSDPIALSHFHELIKGVSSQLSLVLPTHMVPSAYVPVTNMPLSGSAKTDRNTLRRLASAMTLYEITKLSGRDSTRRLPTTAKETIMQKLWSQALNVPEAELSADDSFFLRGGDSVAAMRLVSYARASKLKISVERIFKHPALTDMAMQVEYLEEAQAVPVVAPFALVSDLADVRRLASTTCGVEQELIEDIYPCTPLQDGLIALSQKNRGSYIAQFVFRMQKELDLDRFCRSWTEVVQHTPSLRTRFIETDTGTLAQVIVSEKIEWSFESDLTAYLKRDKARGMPINQATTRFAIVREVPQHGYVESSRRYFIMTAHHATYDGWSLNLLFEKLERTYAGAEASPSPNFNMFVAQLSETNLMEAQSFWQDALTDAPQSTFPNSSGLETQPQTHLQTKYVISLPSDWQKKSEYTASTRIRAAWSLLLGAYSGTQDVVFAASLNGRTVPLEGIEQMVAPTLTTVPVRVTFDKQQQTVGELLAAIQAQSTAAMPFEHYGLQNIKRLSPEIGAACNMQTLLVVETTSTVADSKSFLGLEPVSGENDGAVFHSFPLSLECAISPAGLNVVLTYDPAAISSRQASRLNRQFDHVFKQLSITSTNDALASIELISPEDRSEIDDWNRNVYVPSTQSVHGLFQKMAQLQPDAPALCSWEGEMSYSTLDMLSSKLSYFLRARKTVGPKMLIPILFEKSVWAVVSMLAVLKAGGAIVPLDPGHPLDRLTGLVKKVDAQLILSSISCAKTAAQLLPDFVAVGHELIEALTAPDATSASVTSSQSDPAFLLFTSGSTGQPKGIIIDHSAFSSSIMGHASTLRFQRGSRNLQFTAYTSDVSMGEIFTSLAVGACICVPSDYERMNDLAGAMERMNVDWAFLTPSVATLLDPMKVPSLKTLLFGGETATGENIKTWSERVYLINSFGPAECSIWTSCNPGISVTDQGTNIGFGLGCLNWVTDPTDYKKLMPIGTIGELVIQGPNVAQGYLKEPTKTNAVFLKDAPWVARGNSSQRVYRTGDLVKYLEDGKIHFIGRRDTQVKLNGLRIEIGEVEEQLRVALPEVTEIAVELVVPKSDKPTKILAAFLGLDTRGNDAAEAQVTQVADTPEARDRLRQLTQGLQNRLRQVLPLHMVPKAFIPLPRLPLTASAKTDRNVLRRVVAELTVHELHSFMTDLDFREPRTPRERQMQKLWSNTLRLPQTEVGANDGFFQRGGDSIAAMRLVSEARRMGLDFSVEDVFRYQTLSALAEKAVSHKKIEIDEEPQPFTLVDSEKLDELKQSAVSTCQIADRLIEDIFPCTPLQTGLVSLAEKIPGSYVTELSFALPSDSPVDRFKAAWETVYQHTQILRTRFFRDSESDLYQVVVRDSIVWSANADCMVVGRPLSKFSLAQDAPNTTDFTLKLHHSIYDEHTLSLLFSLFQHAYNGTPLPEVNGFSMFIKSLGSAATDAKSFWQSHLDHAPIPSFPTLWSASYDPRPSQTIDLSVTVSQQSSSGVTMATRIQAAWALVIGSYTDAKDVVFGTTLSGRSSALPGIERILGPTITTVPVRISFEPAQQLLDLLTNIQRQSMERLPFEQFGIQNIQKMSSEARDACKFQNILVVQHSAVANYIAEPNNQTPVLQLDDARTQATNFTGYSLIVECVLSPDRVHIKLHFDPSILDCARARSIIDQLGHVLGQICAETDTMRISDIEHLSQNDLQAIRLWNRHVPAPVETCVHDAIKVQNVARTHLPALCFGSESITYGDLDHTSDKLARYFKDSGVQIGEFVPVCFEKSALAVICMLGIWKAGGAYVPLDPTHPKDRHRSILGTTSAKRIVTSEESALLFVDLDISILAIGHEFLEQLPDVDRPVAISARPSDPAYAIFTSGSTGEPKGVVVQHSAITTSTISLGKALGLSTSSRLLQFAAYTFDASVGEIWTTLLHGGCVCIPDEQERRANVSEAISRMRVTVASFSPSFVNVLEPKEVPTIETLVVAGEAMTDNVIEKWASRVNLVNGYGPTEASVLCVTHKVDSRSTPIDTIGNGTSVVSWIVDPSDHNKLLPIGCVGELLLQGPALAQGYLNDDRKTSKSFITNPSWASRYGLADEQERFYKTGDLVRYGVDGSLRFVTRKDTQVKLRGHRVELGEIESKAYGIIPTAKHVVAEVVSSKLSGGSQTIALFVVGMDNTTDASSSNTETPEAANFVDLDRRLAKMLPSYMIPSMYVSLDSMPLNQNRKADRKKLQQYVQDSSIEDLCRFSLSNVGKVGPRTPRERLILKLWSQVLQRNEEDISIHDSFIRSGGDSIAAIKMVSLARSSGLSLPMEHLLKDMTLEELAVSCEQIAYHKTVDVEPFALIGDKHEQILERASTVCNVPKESISDIYPCTVVQEPFLQLRATEGGFRTVQWAFEMDKETPLAAIVSAWEAVVSARALLRTRVFEDSSSLLQAVIETPLHWGRVDSLSTYIDADKNEMFGFGSALTRQAVFPDSSTGKICFVWTCAHAIYDLVSIKLILNNFKQCLRGDLQLPPEIPYTRFVKHLLQQEGVSDFWENHFLEYQRSQIYNTLEQPKPDTLLKAQLELPVTPANTFTLATYIQSAWSIAVSQQTGGRDVILSLSLSGRDVHVDGIEQIAGPTATSVPMRVTINPDATVDEFMQHTQNQAASVTRWQHTGIEVIKRTSSEAKSACESSIPIIIHASGPLDEVDDVRAGFKRLLTRQTSPGSSALSLTIAVTGQNMVVLVPFDSHAIATEKLSGLLRAFVGVLFGLMNHSGLRMRLREIQSTSDGSAYSSLELERQDIVEGTISV